jgi:hypothetical protein
MNFGVMSETKEISDGHGMLSREIRGLFLHGTTAGGLMNPAVD